MFSGQIAFYADNFVADDRLVTEYEKLATLIFFVVTISQSVLSENHESASGLVGVRSISVSLGLFGRPGGILLCENSWIQSYRLQGIRTMSL